MAAEDFWPARLMRHQLDPCEALVSCAAIGAAPEEVFAGRGWSAADWTLPVTGY